MMLVAAARSIGFPVANRNLPDRLERFESGRAF
jgi:hypothetical protein